MVRYLSRTDLIQDCKKRIFSFFSVILAKLRREHTRDESSLSPDRMLEGELDLTHTSRDWRELEKIPDQYDLHTSEWK